jgi:hypothetical protein
MVRLIAVYGTIAGLVVAIPMVWFMVTMKPGAAMEGGALYGYLTMILALTAVFLGIKHYRDRVLGGAIKFGQALLVGLGISAVASVIYVIGWELSLELSGFDFAESYTKAMLDAARAKGTSEAELQEMLAATESFTTRYKNPLFRLPITFIEMFPVGVLISLVSAGLLRNSRLLPARTKI